jgi:hypothetical protein
VEISSLLLDLLRLDFSQSPLYGCAIPRRNKLQRRKQMENAIDPQKIRTNIDNLLKKANPRQLRLFYLIAYEIIKK